MYSLDFETYSESGYRFSPEQRKWSSDAPGAAGLPGIGAYAYGHHPSTEVLCAAYAQAGQPVKLWVPGMPLPEELFNSPVCAWNSFFEWSIWNGTCVRKYGWPARSLQAIFDSAALARANGFSGKLANAAKQSGAVNKLETGGSLIKYFCMPRNPTKKDSRLRIRPHEDLEKFAQFLEYNRVDVIAEQSVASKCPPLSDLDMKYWTMDADINERGVRLDTVAVNRAIQLIEQEYRVFTEELKDLTHGVVTSANEVKRIAEYCGLESVSQASVTKALSGSGLNAKQRRVLGIRQLLGASSVKKLYRMSRMADEHGRVRGLFTFRGAMRTGRWSGAGIQPQNLPSSGPSMLRCTVCDRISVNATCAGCLSDKSKPQEWGPDTVEQVLRDLHSGGSSFRDRWGPVIPVISGCLRGMFRPNPGHDFICSDFSAIEAVVLAALAGEQWRLDVFKGHGRIYEVTAANLTGRTLEEYEAYAKEHNRHHPDRKLGKIAELASGYGGSVGAWKNFGADKLFVGDMIEPFRSEWGSSGSELSLQDWCIQRRVRMWRDDSPNIRKFWYACMDAALDAMRSPGYWYEVRRRDKSQTGVSYMYDGKALRCCLPSGQALVYQNAEILETQWDDGSPKYDLAYLGKDTKGNWTQIRSYGAKLAENITQAVAGDILKNSMLRLESSGYPVVLHVHDEIVSEVPEGYGSVEEFERLAQIVPPWAYGWPIRVANGWRGKFYRK